MTCMNHARNLPVWQGCIFRIALGACLYCRNAARIIRAKQVFDDWAYEIIIYYIALQSGK